jgi:hypothetical protein
VDSSEFVIETGDNLTVKVGRLDFLGVASEEGFERTDISIEDSTSFVDAFMEPYSGEGEGWVSLGRQGMQDDASPINLGEWRGLHGTNYTGMFGTNARGEGSGYLGLGEFYSAFAIRKLAGGKSVLVSLLSFGEGDEVVFKQILSSFRIIDPQPQD